MQIVIFLIALLGTTAVAGVDYNGTHTDYFANQWSLDALGNWLELQTTLGANNATQNREHDYLNQIDNITSALPTVTPVYDEAGNLRYDGQFVYQYDAWNRLCQVTLPQANAPPGTPGTLVKHFLYDALGRLIRVQSPYPDPATGETTDEVRSERIFYDGVRRVQEYVTDPLPDTSFAAQQGNAPAQEALASQSGANHNSTNSGTETSLLRGAGAGGGGGGGGLPPGVSLAREYIWGPGDRGLDELLCQFGPDRTPTYAIHDGGGDIIALADKNGAGSTPRLVWQSTYDAYGQVIEAQTLHAHPPLHAGHKGLFFDRLDAGIVDPVTFNETPRLMPAGHAGSTGTARIIGYARNRHLHTGFGRWLQRDPNATGATLLGELAAHGAIARCSSMPFALDAHYGDGCNVYGYVNNNSLTGGDPLGLWIGYLGSGLQEFDGFGSGVGAREDAFDAIDEIIGEHIGSQAAWMEAVQRHNIAALELVGQAAISAFVPGGDTVLTAYGLYQAASSGNMSVLDAIFYLSNRGKARMVSGALRGYAATLHYTPRVPMYYGKPGTAHCVYFGYDKAGRLRYVGITDDSIRRFMQHANDPRLQDLRFSVKIRGLTELEARSVETFVICVRKPDLRNRWLSISPVHSFFAQAMNDGWDILQRFGISIFQ